MGKKIRIGLIVILGMMLSTACGSAFGAQLAINSNDPMLYGRPIASQWAGEFMGNYFGVNPSGEILTLETKKMGVEVIPYLKNWLQWDGTPADMAGFSPDSAERKILQYHGSAWFPNWAAEDIFLNEKFISTNEAQVEDDDDASGLPPLPNALWLCGIGIIGILSVRRTNDHSNVT